MKKILSVILILTLLVSVLAGCSNHDTQKVDKDDPNAPIYFAWYGPMTGDSKQYGDTEKVAVELALEKINNENGGVLGGRKIEVEFFDDKNDAKEAVTIANKIIGENKFTAVIGGLGSTPSMAAAPLYEEAKIINYSPTASHADFTSLGDFIFRNNTTQAVETAAYADYVYDEMGIRSVAILNLNDDWGNSIAKIFTETFEAKGGEIVSTEPYTPNQTSDFTPMISKVKHLNPEAFFPVAYYQDSVNILKQADGLDFKPQIILTSATLKQELVDLAGDLANGSFLMSAYTPDIDTDRFKEVIGEYKNRTGKEGDAFVTQTYDIVMQLATAIEEAGSADPIKVRDVLASMTDYECLAGTYSMNELGDAIRQLQAIKIIDGKFVNITNGDPSAN